MKDIVGGGWIYEKSILEDCVVDDGIIKYKGVSLWKTIYSSISAIDIRGGGIYLSNEGSHPTTIIGKIPIMDRSNVFDYTTYGTWETFEEGLNWLNNPKSIY